MTDPPDIREQLAALLAGDLDEPAATALQARIDAEPWVAQLADDVADLLVELGGVDDVDPPDGFSAALREGLEAEIGHVLPPEGAALPVPTAVRGGQPAMRPTPGPPGRRDASGPAQRDRRLRRALSIAAALAILGISTVGILNGFGGGADDSTADSTDAGVAADAGFAEAERMAGATEDDAESLEADAADGGTDDAADTTLSAPATAQDEADDAAAEAGQGAGEAVTEEADAADEDAGGSTADDPTVLVLGSVENDAEVLDAVGAQPVLDELLGRYAAGARELAATYRDQLLLGPDFGDGTAAGTCLTDTLAAAGGDQVPAVALRLDPAPGPAVGYALVTSRDGAVLDGVDVWVMTLDGCAVQQVLRQR